jgi:hypothetical protein
MEEEEDDDDVTGTWCFIYNCVTHSLSPKRTTKKQIVESCTNRYEYVQNYKLERGVKKQS